MSNLKEDTEHELKIWPEYFDAVESGKKNFEVRKLDRLFGTGHILYLREWSPLKGYSGRETRKQITYVMAGGQWGLAEGNCILGIAAYPTPATPSMQWVKTIEFAEWIGSNGYINNGDGSWYHESDGMKLFTEVKWYSTTELYKLFSTNENLSKT